MALGVWSQAFLATLSISLFPTLVLPFIPAHRVGHAAAFNLQHCLLSFSAGGLLGDVFLHSVPHLLEKGTPHVHTKDGRVVHVHPVGELETNHAAAGAEGIKDEVGGEDMMFLQQPVHGMHAHDEHGHDEHAAVASATTDHHEHEHDHEHQREQAHEHHEHSGGGEDEEEHKHDHTRSLTVGVSCMIGFISFFVSEKMVRLWATGGPSASKASDDEDGDVRSLPSHGHMHHSHSHSHGGHCHGRADQLRKRRDDTATAASGDAAIDDNSTMDTRLDSNILAAESTSPSPRIADRKKGKRRKSADQQQHEAGASNAGDSSTKATLSSPSSPSSTDSDVPSKGAGSASSSSATTGGAATAADGAPANDDVKVGWLNLQVGGYLNLAADFLHNFTDGIAIGASFIGGSGLAMATTISVFFHEIPHEIGDFTILVQNGFSVRSAIMAQFFTAGGAFLGTLVGLLAERSELVEDFLLAFTSGGFVYVATVTVLPDILQTPATASQILLEAGCFLFGVLLMVVVAAIE